MTRLSNRFRGWRDRPKRRDGTPRFAPLLLCDHVTGEITAGAIVAALFRRERTGEGCAIEVPMHETTAAFVLQENLRAGSVRPTARAGWRRAGAGSE